MPIGFDFVHLGTQGFRGFDDIELDLVPGQATYLIGPNNSGKSTAVSAIALALRGGGFHRFTPGPFDFYHSPDGTVAERFYVTLKFKAAPDCTLPAVQGAGQPEYVHGVQVRGDVGKRGSSTHKRYLIGSDGKPITISPRTPLKGEKKVEFKEHGLGWSPVYARLDDIRSHLPDVWLLRPDNQYRALFEWRTGPLQMIARLLSKRFAETEWQFEYAEGKFRPMPAAMESAHSFAVSAIGEFPFWKEELKPRLDAALSSYLGRQSKINLGLSLQALEDWIAQQLVTGFASDADGALTPLDRMGDGWQSLVRLAALDVLRDFPDVARDRVVLLYEEPETFLHPHLRRKLRTVLDDLASAGWTVVATTHAPEFISLTHPQTICRLRRAGGTVGKGVFLTEKTADSLRLQEKIDERGNHELFFANRVILCEGKDDILAIAGYLGKRKADLDSGSVSIVDVGGVENMPDYVAVLQDLNVPWCAITDEDLQEDGTIKEKTAAVRRKLVDLRRREDITPIWPGSLEACLGVPDGKKAKPPWQQVYLSPKNLDQIMVDHPGFAATAEEVWAWIG